MRKAVASREGKLGVRMVGARFGTKLCHRRNHEYCWGLERLLLGARGWVDAWGALVQDIGTSQEEGKAGEVLGQSSCDGMCCAGERDEPAWTSLAQG